jgi:hypothetical protein
MAFTTNPRAASKVMALKTRRRKPVPKPGAPMAGARNPERLKALPPKGRAAAANRGSGRKLRGR